MNVVPRYYAGSVMPPACLCMQVYALDKRFLDPRRPLKAKATPEEIEERLVPYNELVLFNTLQYVTQDKQVRQSRACWLGEQVSGRRFNGMSSVCAQGLAVCLFTVDVAHICTDHPHMQFVAGLSVHWDCCLLALFHR